MQPGGRVSHRVGVFLLPSARMEVQCACTGGVRQSSLAGDRPRGATVLQPFKEKGSDHTPGSFTAEPALEFCKKQSFKY